MISAASFSELASTLVGLAFMRAPRYAGSNAKKGTGLEAHEDGFRLEFYTDQSKGISSIQTLQTPLGGSSLLEFLLRLSVSFCCVGAVEYTTKPPATCMDLT